MKYLIFMLCLVSTTSFAQPRSEDTPTPDDYVRALTAEVQLRVEENIQLRARISQLERQIVELKSAQPTKK